MATFRFDPNARLLHITARIVGRNVARITMALDTGSSVTVLHRSVFLDISLDPDLSSQRTSLTTLSRTEQDVPLLTIRRIDVLGQTVENLNVACMTFPLGLQIHADGLLGLNFLRHFKLFINFPKGVLVLQERNPRHLLHRLSQIWEILGAHW